MTAYYNEIDPAAAAVLRELALRDVIPPGDVDTRSIKEVTPDDIRGYTQCHFFAGAGLWPAGARLAGWPDDRRIWTGSCPCQGESLAGKRLGADDPRHLWPDFYRLIRAERPPVVMGEQVAAAAGTHWLDGVCANLADEDYSARAVDIPACAIDAPHQRNRLYWTAVDNRVGARLEGQRGHVAGAEKGRSVTGRSPSAADDLLFGDAQGERRGEGRPEHEFRSWRDAPAGADVFLQPHAGGESARRDSRGILGSQAEGESSRIEHRHLSDRSRDASDGIFADSGRELRGSGPGITQNRQIGSNSDGRNGSWWADAEWIVSPLDGKARRTKPGLPFLVDGLVGRADLWRLCGNSVLPKLVAEVITAFLESETACERRSNGNGEWQDGVCK